MASEGQAELTEQLRATPPPTVARLPSEDLQHLAGVIRSARHRQAAELQAAGDQAFNLVPRLLRGPIKKIVGI